jgi:hypothetical protein
MCPTYNGFVQQSFNGDITGCFRIPALQSSSLVVALQAYLLNSGVAPSSPTTTISPPTTIGDVSLSLRPSIVTPGETVAVTGRFLGQPPATRNTLGNLCWDGCRTGLQESIQLRWSSATTFHTSLIVPDTAWLVSNNGVVSIHPLVSGSYQVGIQCLGSISGCDFAPANAQTTIQLNAPTPERCASGQSCATIHLSAPATAVGDEVRVTGWAPLQTIIGQPFGIDLSVAPASKGQKYQPLSFTRTQKSGGFNVVLAPKILRVTASKTWANLGRVHTLLSTWAGPSAIEPEGGSNVVAWCQPSGLDIVGGPKEITISTAGATAALAGSDLTMFSSPSSDPQCSDVLLDPRYGATVYAGFDTAQNNSAPPVYLAGLYTTDSGAIWHAVPTPPGDTLESFSGFTTEGSSVLALFASQNSYYSNTKAPPGTANGLVEAEVTWNGGATWSLTTLGCPSAGPCVTLGPYYLGHCAMNSSLQPLLVGPAGATASTGVKWTSSSWITTVNSCFSQQLIVTSPHDLLLLDPSSEYPLLHSTDSGKSWSNYALPLIPGASPGQYFASFGSSLLLAPNGSLFASVASPSGQRQELFRLNPAATSWCQVPKVFPSKAPSYTFSTLRVNRTDLLWSQTNNAQGAVAPSGMHAVPLSQLRC